jgi:hypothetical protein
MSDSLPPLPPQNPGGQEQPQWSTPPEQPSYTPPAGGFGVPAAKPDNYLVWAILTTLFCCLPFGIVSIVNAAKVDGLWSAGQYGEAAEAADNAKKWAIWAVAAGVTAAVIGGIFQLLVFVAAAGQQ